MTAKVCTDEQKVHKRHSNKDEYPQQYEVQNSVLNMLLNQIIVMQMYRRQTEGKSIYQGRSWRLRVNRAKKSAEVIVLEGKRDANRYRIGLTNKEGLNVNLQEIRLGKLSQPSLKVNYGQLKRCKELLIDDLRTAEYVTRTLGGVRGALRQFLAEPSTRLGVRFSFFYSC